MLIQHSCLCTITPRPLHKVDRPVWNSALCPSARCRLGKFSRATQRQHFPSLCSALSSPDDPSDDESSVDIDALAKQLSQEAERLRRSESGKEASTSSSPPVESNRPLGSSSGEGYSSSTFLDQDPYGVEARQREAEILKHVGEGGFLSSEFEIEQQLGKLSWVTEGAKESPLQMSGATTQEVQAVIAFSARYYSGGPFQNPVRVLLKEFLPAAKPVGCNELQTAVQLAGIPSFKWQAAAADLSADPPVVPILGYFKAGQSETGWSLSQDSVRNSQETLWLVYKWENLQPLSFYPSAQQAKISTGFSFWGMDVEAEALRARCLMLRSIVSGVVSALAYCHEKGVAHTSVGTGSFLLNTFDDRRAQQLVVKLDNFGFACSVSGKEASANADLSSWEEQLGPTHPLIAAQKEDLRALAIVILETIFSALAEGGPSAATSADALRRLLVDVFHCNIQQFRQYCAHETEWTAPVILLEQFDCAGWDLVESLVLGRQSAAYLQNLNAFCDLGREFGG